MMVRRIHALIRKEFIHLIKDWWMPAFMLFGGALELLLVGWATSRPITNLPLMVWDQDHSAQSRSIVADLTNTNTFHLQEKVQGMKPIEEALERGNITAALVIPPDYSSKLHSPSDQASLAVLINGAETVPAQEALRAVEGVVREVSQEVILERHNLSPRTLTAFDFSLRVWFNETLTEAYYTTPAELGLMLEFTVMLFAALTFSRERELGTLEQLLVMPFSSLELMIGKAIPVALVGIFDFYLMLGMVRFAFGVPVRGSMLLLFVLAVVYIIVELSKGMVISIVSQTQHQAFLLVLLVGMVDFMFTGYAAPVEGMPVILQRVATLIPAHHWLSILRGLLLKGSGLRVLWPHALALAGLGLAISAFSWRFVRRNLD